jgi:hypothetical protein
VRKEEEEDVVAEDTCEGMLAVEVVVRVGEERRTEE